MPAQATGAARIACAAIVRGVGNPRTIVIEDRALSLADELLAAGHALLAARLRETVPDHVGTDEHLGMLTQQLQGVTTQTGVPASLAAGARRILIALEDLPATIGRRGRVWIAWSEDAYFGHWEAGEQWLEEMPAAADLETVLRWARRRADEIALRPSWDQHEYYSAGSTPVADFSPLGDAPTA
ncbi:MAG: hypothetical protein QOH99_717 [Frankiaceae bacterium]|nr:hypothetical protein [Frankiaceae bacterium]